MRKVKFSYRMELEFSQPVWQHSFSLLSFPLRLPEQQISEFSWSLQPDATLQFQRDYFGNSVGVGRHDDMHASFCFEMNGTALLNQKQREAEVCLPVYRYPSAACGMTVELKNFLKQIQPSASDVMPKAMYIMEQLHQTFRYEKGSTSVSTTAGQAFIQGCGVCQDYAHIFIALCRASGIPARYVAGIIAGEGETHAWAEVYDGGMWHGFDPTQNRLVNDGYLKLAQGRDYLDCRLNRGVFCGNAEQRQNVYVSMEELLV